MPLTFQSYFHKTLIAIHEYLMRFLHVRMFDHISYDQVLSQHLKVMDASAIALARDNKLPIIVFSLAEPGGFKTILAGNGTYTKVYENS